MTPQEFFDRAVTGVIGQGKPALARPNSIACAYRAPDGCRCAAGHNIPDDDRVCREFDLPVPKVYTLMREVAQGREPSACGELPPSWTPGALSTVPAGRPKRRAALRTFDPEGQDSWESVGETDPRYDAMFDAGPECFGLGPY